MVQVGVRYQPGRRAHEIPGLGAQVKTDFQFGNAPVALHGGTRIALNGQAGVLLRQERCVVNHRGSELFSGEPKATGRLRLPAKHNSLFIFHYFLVKSPARTMTSLFTERYLAKARFTSAGVKAAIFFSRSA